MLGMSGRIYLVGALLLGLWFLYSGVRVALERTMLRARAVLLDLGAVPAADLRADAPG